MRQQPLSHATYAGYSDHFKAGWQIFDSAGTVIASDTDPQGWDVQLAGYTNAGTASLRCLEITPSQDTSVYPPGDYEVSWFQYGTFLEEYHGPFRTISVSRPYLSWRGLSVNPSNNNPPQVTYYWHGNYQLAGEDFSLNPPSHYEGPYYTKFLAYNPATAQYEDMIDEDRQDLHGDETFAHNWPADTPFPYGDTVTRPYPTRVLMYAKYFYQDGSLAHVDNTVGGLDLYVPPYCAWYYDDLGGGDSASAGASAGASASAGGESASASAGGESASASAGGESASASAGGESASASAGGESASASAGGERASASAGGESASASAGGESASASAGGESASASAGGESASASAGGESASASAGGESASASAGASAGASASAGGESASASAGGESASASTGGESASASTGGESASASAGGESASASTGGESASASAGASAGASASEGDDHIACLTPQILPANVTACPGDHIQFQSQFCIVDDQTEFGRGYWSGSDLDQNTGIAIDPDSGAAIVGDKAEGDYTITWQTGHGPTDQYASTTVHVRSGGCTAGGTDTHGTVLNPIDDVPPCVDTPFPTMDFAPLSELYKWPAQLVTYMGKVLVYLAVPPACTTDGFKDHVTQVFSAGWLAAPGEIKTALGSTSTQQTYDLQFQSIADFDTSDPPSSSVAQRKVVPRSVTLNTGSGRSVSVPTFTAALPTHMDLSPFADQIALLRKITKIILWVMFFWNLFWRAYNYVTQSKGTE